MSEYSSHGAEAVRGMSQDGTPLGVCAAVVLEGEAQWPVAGLRADVVIHDADGREVMRVHDAPVRSEDPGAGRDRNSGSATAVSVLAPVQTAVIAMKSRMRDAEQRFQSITVSLDAVPGNQVEGISPLYHVVNVDAEDGMAAVVQLTSRLGVDGLLELMQTLSDNHEGSVELRLADLHDGDGSSVKDDRIRDASRSVANDAAVLAPWLDMDPNARLAGDPVSYLLAMAPNAMQVGLLSEQWILGQTQ